MQSRFLPPRKIQCIFFGLLFISYVYAHQTNFRNATAVSRLSLLRALVVNKTFNIDAFHDSTPDKAIYRGHYYSDKAPGTVVLALPAFCFAVVLLRVEGVSLESHFPWFFTSWFACAGSIGIVSALGGTALFALLCRYVSPRFALLTTLALFLGAAPLPYATMMFSHALVVGLLALALWAIECQSEVKERKSNAAVELSSLEEQRDRAAWNTEQDRSQILPVQSQKMEARTDFRRARREGKSHRLHSWFLFHQWDLLAGFACGWALASEFSAGLIVAGIVLWLNSLSWRRLLPLFLAAIPPLLLIPIYSWVCFGTPFTLAYSHTASFPDMKEGLYAIKWPNAETAYSLLFSPTRGLFFWTPFLLIAGAGYYELFTESRRLFWLTYIVPVVHIIVISGRTWDWQAGHTLGPRLLAPILPLLALPCAFGAKRFRRLGVALAAYSVLITSLATLTDATPDYSISNPLTELAIPLLLKGEFSPNVGTALGLPPYASIALFYLLLISGVIWLWRGLPPVESPAARFEVVERSL